MYIWYLQVNVCVGSSVCWGSRTMSLSVCPHHPPTCPPNYEHKGGIASLLPLPFVTILTPGRWLHRPIAHYLDRRPAPIISGQAVTRRKITVIPVASSAAVLLLLLIFPFVLLQPLFLSLSLINFPSFITSVILVHLVCLFCFILLSFTFSLIFSFPPIYHHEGLPRPFPAPVADGCLPRRG